MSASDQKQPRVRRPARWFRLIISLVVSPLIAGGLGGLLVYLGVLPMLLIEDGSVDELGSLLAGIGGVSVIAILFGIVFTYMLGFPLILAGWLLIHIFGDRSNLQFAIMIALAGLIFSIGLFAEFFEELSWQSTPTQMIAGLVPFIAGALSGTVTGLFIGRVGYQPARTSTNPD